MKKAIVMALLLVGVIATIGTVTAGIISTPPVDAPPVTNPPDDAPPVTPPVDI